MPNGWIITPDRTTWPDPDDPLGVEWALRYGQPNKAQLMWAASVIGAYKHLLEVPLTQSRRNLSTLRRQLVRGEQDG